MYIDNFTRFSDSQAVTASAASTNLIDLRAAHQLSAGQPIYLVSVVTVAMTDAGSDSTITVILESDTTAAFGSPTTVQTLGTFAAVSAVGTRIVAPVMNFATAERFLRVTYTVANGNLTTGSFTTLVTLDPSLWVAYPDNITIS
jgi:hypothetical protein